MTAKTSRLIPTSRYVAGYDNSDGALCSFVAAERASSSASEGDSACEKSASTA